MILDHTNRRVLDVLESREKEFVIKYLHEEVESGLLAGVEGVTCGLWEGYVTAAQETFGKGIRITIDRFDVMKDFQEQLTDARRQIQRGLDKGGAKALKGTRWLWVKNRENLTEPERAELEGLKKRFPLLQQLAEQRERLRAIFEDRTIPSAAEGRPRLEAGLQEAKDLALKGLEASGKTLTTWMDKIANSFVSRSSNGRTEGFNHGLRSTLWRAFGMTDFQHFRLRVLDRFGRPASP